MLDGVSRRIADINAGDDEPLNGPLAAQQLVEDHAEREQVAPRIERPPLDLLGRHVRHRADDHPEVRDRRLRGGKTVLAELGAADASEPEVEHLHAALARHHHVARLQVAVRDVLLVRGRQRVGELQRELEKPRERQSARER